MLATSTHCRDINQLPHDPVLLSTTSLSTHMLYKYQQSKKMPWHPGKKPVYSSQEATWLSFIESRSEGEDIDLIEYFWPV